MQYSAAERAKWLKGWKRSGKSISAYARENGLVRWTFTKWLKAERESGQHFVEVSAQVMQAAARGGEILIENGDVKIHIPLAIGGVELRAVLEGLGVAL